MHALSFIAWVSCYGQRTQQSLDVDMTVVSGSREDGTHRARIRNFCKKGGEGHHGTERTGRQLDVQGRRLDRHDAARIITRLRHTAGVIKPITPHGLRHTFVATARAANVDVRDIQTAVGHADPRSTMR